MAHGKTLLMRNIRRPGPTTIHSHSSIPRWIRRNPILMAQWFKKPGATLGRGNTSYVNPERDQRPGRRLRPELVNG